MQPPVQGFFEYIINIRFRDHHNICQMLFARRLFVRHAYSLYAQYVCVSIISCSLQNRVSWFRKKTDTHTHTERDCG